MAQILEIQILFITSLLINLVENKQNSLQFNINTMFEYPQSNKIVCQVKTIGLDLKCTQKSNKRAAGAISFGEKKDLHDFEAFEKVNLDEALCQFYDIGEKTLYSLKWTLSKDLQLS